MGVVHFVRTTVPLLFSRFRNGLNRRFQRSIVRFLIKRFVPEEKRLPLILNDGHYTAERIIVNYFQGLVLFGQHGTGRMMWEGYASRALITRETVHIPLRIRQYAKRGEFEIRRNHQFEATVRACQRDHWTWITEPVISLYKELHDRGFAHSIEAYRNDDLVAGIWGLGIGKTFTIMSMFHRADRAGSILMATLLNDLNEGTFRLIDCGVLKPNFERFGAKAVPKEQFIELLVQGLQSTPRHVNCIQPDGASAPNPVSDSDSVSETGE